MNKDINIIKKTTIYDVKCGYHSDMMCQNYDAGIVAHILPKGRVSIYPDSGDRDRAEKSFMFKESDPDRIIAIAKMMLAFAEMVKENNKNTIDISDMLC